jgi:hypothetical protein
VKVELTTRRPSEPLLSEFLTPPHAPAAKKPLPKKVKAKPPAASKSLEATLATVVVPSADAAPSASTSSSRTDGRFYAFQEIKMLKRISYQAGQVHYLEAQRAAGARRRVASVRVDLARSTVAYRWATRRFVQEGRFGGLSRR